MAYRDDDPTILVFGDSQAGIAAASETAVTHGGRVAAALSIAEATDRLDSQIAVDLVIVDVSVDHGPVLDRLLRRLLPDRAFDVVIWRIYKRFPA